MRAKRTMQGSSRAVAPRLVRREQERERVLAAAALYRVIALGFSYPDPMLINSVREATVTAQFYAALGRVAFHQIDAYRSVGARSPATKKSVEMPYSSAKAINTPAALLRW